jgi:hypothetical protein
MYYNTSGVSVNSMIGGLAPVFFVREGCHCFTYLHNRWFAIGKLMRSSERMSFNHDFLKEAAFQ